MEDGKAGGRKKETVSYFCFALGTSLIAVVTVASARALGVEDAAQ
jgi:hypothetical protein